MRALKFAAFQAWKSVWGRCLLRYVLKCSREPKAPTHALQCWLPTRLMQRCCAWCCGVPSCRLLWSELHPGMVFVPGEQREAVELLLCLQVALEKNGVRVEEAYMARAMGCSSADTKLWVPMAPFLILHEGASTQNLTAFHFPKSRFPSSSFFFSTFTAAGTGEGDFLYPEARSDEMQLLTNKARGRKCSFWCNSSLRFPAFWRKRCLVGQKARIAAPNGGRCVWVAALMGWGRGAPGTLLVLGCRGAEL